MLLEQLREPDCFNPLVLCDTTSADDSYEAKFRLVNSAKLIEMREIEQITAKFLKAAFSAQTFNDKPNIIDEIRNIILPISLVHAEHCLQ